MSYFITHKPCPRCGSSDAFAEYSDGHKWCFSCRHYVPPTITSISQVENVLFETKKLKKGELPYDLSLDIPKEPYAWLKQYGVTSDEILENHLGWSAANEMLVFPYFGENDDLLLWQGRYFPTRNPKVFTSGYPDDYILLHHTATRESSRRVVVVEDAISAIKVSRICDSSELLGSNLSKSKAIRLSKLYEHLTLWLDYDKLSSMIKFEEMYRILFKKIDYIATEKDPKMFSREQIKEYLNVND